MKLEKYYIAPNETNNLHNIINWFQYFINLLIVFTIQDGAFLIWLLEGHWHLKHLQFRESEKIIKYEPELVLQQQNSQHC